MERYFSSGIASSTSRVYRAGINRYLGMCHELCIPATPTSEDVLCKFVSYLALNNISIGTIKVYLAGVRQLHVSGGYPPPNTAEMAKLAQVMRGIKISQAVSNGTTTARHRLPITPEILRQIKAQWQREPQSQDKVMLWAAFLTCFFGFFRSGEICASQADTVDPAADLSVDDVKVDSISNPRRIQIRLQSSKTDPFKEGATINIPRTEDDLCPVAALLTWLVYRGKSPGPLFRFQSGTPLTRARLVGELRRVLTALGLEAEKFSGHSFRKGAATTAAARGVPDSQIKILGRWKSAVFQVYLQPSSQQLASVAARLTQGPATPGPQPGGRQSI